MPNLTGIDTVAATVAEWKQLASAAGNDPKVIGSYGNGRYANTTIAKEALPNRTHVQYDVNGALPAMDILDIENFDAVPSQAHGWSRAHQEIKVNRPLFGPFLYCSASVTSQVVSDMLDHGWRRSQFGIQSAHYGPHPHICGPGTCGFPQADATQHNDHGPHNENVDLNLWTEHCFTAKAPDPDARYDLFDNRKRSIIGRRTEKDVVQRYDRLRATQTHTKHPHRAALILLRVQLGALARRLAKVIQGEHGKTRPTQAWRLRELRDRQQGKRLV